ncbi:hypothetical protein [Geobacter sp.]|uniref:lipid-binding SYLF domain-containing protein n=1 Tax=Geobacter sp. TaxID=46610 RepID=UPI002603CF67|nr:hypothetical protein [Geobacter sp.]
MKLLTVVVAILVGTLSLAVSVTAHAADTNAPTAKLDKESSEAINLFRKADSKMAKFFEEAAGYAIFPGITKGAAGIGAAYGEGEVFAKGKLIGTATVTQVTLGLQLGGQEYAELIFFENEDTLNQFASGKFAMSAQVSAVLAAEGSAGNAKYQMGVMVFTIPKGGVMFEASIGGQKFSFTPLRRMPLY